MITSRDMSAAEETFVYLFQTRRRQLLRHYKDVLLRATMEATMSAPTYFYALERFVDGGTTTYNNPSLAAYMEAVSYSRADKKEDLSCYRSTGSPCSASERALQRQFIKPSDTLNPHGLDIAFWLNWLMTATGQECQCYADRYHAFAHDPESDRLQEIPDLPGSGGYPAHTQYRYPGRA